MTRFGICVAYKMLPGFQSRLNCSRGHMLAKFFSGPLLNKKVLSSIELAFVVDKDFVF